MKQIIIAVVVAMFILSYAPYAHAQEKGSSSHDSDMSALIEAAEGMYGGVKKIVLKTAELMPEEHYNFRPVDTVRTFGQIVGHIADAQYAMCSTVLGIKNPALKIEKTKSSKADLIASVKEAFAFCDRAYESMNGSSAAESVRFMGGDSPRLGVLNVNSIHTIEHYGNLVTYMRIKGLVPPTSDPAFMKSLQQD